LAIVVAVVLCVSAAASVIACGGMTDAQKLAKIKFIMDGAYNAYFNLSKVNSMGAINADLYTRDGKQYDFSTREGVNGYVREYGQTINSPYETIMEDFNNRYRSMNAIMNVIIDENGTEALKKSFRLDIGTAGFNDFIDKAVEKAYGVTRPEVVELEIEYGEAVEGIEIWERPSGDIVGEYVQHILIVDQNKTKEDFQWLIEEGWEIFGPLTEEELQWYVEVASLNWTFVRPYSEKVIINQEEFDSYNTELSEYTKLFSLVSKVCGNSSTSAFEIVGLVNDVVYFSLNDAGSSGVKDIYAVEYVDDNDYKLSWFQIQEVGTGSQKGVHIFDGKNNEVMTIGIGEGDNLYEEGVRDMGIVYGVATRTSVKQLQVVNKSLDLPGVENNAALLNALINIYNQEMAQYNSLVK
ncbi:MAG: hypothetical protein FWE84_02185, partial [Firmicutes bacterium]|nr:hypothetical protein [Bacillota bacterium]